MGGEGGGVYPVILVTGMCKDLLWLGEIFFFRVKPNANFSGRTFSRDLYIAVTE